MAVITLLAVQLAWSRPEQQPIAPAAGAQPEAGRTPVAVATDYVIGPQDVLSVVIFNHPNLSGKFGVEADGTLSLPLAGRIVAGGQTVRLLQLAVERRLEDGGFLNNAQVSVSIDQYRSQRVFFVGEVRQTGSYSLTGQTTLIEALAKAGGTTGAANSEVLIVRPTAPNPTGGPVLPTQADASEVIRIDLKELQGGTLRQNIILRDGDTVFVPQAASVYVFGQVRSPGAYAVQKDTTVLQALSLAGGLTDRGATSRIRITRVVNGKKVDVKVKLTDLVQGGDTIIVPERYF